MKASIVILSLLFGTTVAMAQSPEIVELPENQWTPITVDEVKSSMRFTNDSIVYLNYSKKATDKVQVKIKTKNGVTMYRDRMQNNEGLAQYDISALPNGLYTVELSVNGEVADEYRLVKD